MLIVCPKCTTSYEVEPVTLGAAGRSVRCSRCRTSWFATAAAPAPALAGAGKAGTDQADGDAVAAFQTELGAAAVTPPQDSQAGAAGPEASDSQTSLPETKAPSIAAGEEPVGPAQDAAANETPGDGAATAAPNELPTSSGPGEPPAPRLSEISIPASEAPGLVPMQAGDTPQPGDPQTLTGEPEDIESFAARRDRNAEARRRRRAMSILPVMICALLAVIVGLIAGRSSVVRHAPQMASLYAAIGLPVNLRGLEFADIKSSTDTHEGVPVLVVEGTIVNATNKPIDVPRLRLAVRKDNGEVYAWTAQPTQPTLGPGETLPFRSRLASPPSDASQVVVRFFNRHDAVTGMK